MNVDKDKYIFSLLFVLFDDFDNVIVRDIYDHIFLSSLKVLYAADLKQEI